MAKIYWRTIKRGTRTFADIPDHLKDEVEALARAEVEDGTITPEEYEKFTGKSY